jgi:hypothetical protein
MRCESGTENLEGGAGEGELTQEGVVADDLGEVSEGYVGFPCTYSMNK